MSMDVEESKVDESHSGDEFCVHSGSKSSNSPSLARVSKVTEENECLTSLVKLGWSSQKADDIQSIDGRLHASMAVSLTRSNGEEKNEFWFLRQIMTPEWVASVSNKVFAPALANKDKPCLKIPPTEKEFWIFIARLLLSLVAASPSGHFLNDSYPLVKSALERGMTSIRYQVLRRAFWFTHSQFTDAMDHCMDRMLSCVSLGRILVLDEAVLATDGVQAKKEKMVINVPGKPHPKGLLIRGICGKFEKSGCVFFLNGRHKHRQSTCPAGQTAMNLINHLEERSTVDHIVLLDEAYPAHMFLGPDGRTGRTKYISAAAKSAVSGSYNKLSEACSTFLHQDQHCTLLNQDTGVLATLHKAQGKDIVIVSDATSPVVQQGQTPTPIRARKVSFNLAVHMALTPVGSPKELLTSLGLPVPHHSAALESMPKLIQHLCNVDVLSPVDLDGSVTRDTLGECSIPHLTMIAESLGLTKNLTRPKLIDYIVERHPKAADGRLEAIRTDSRKRKALPASMTTHDLHKLKDENDALVRDLLCLGTEPQFHEFYRANYGLHDRFNATVYACFKFSNASGPFQLMSWLSLIIYVIDARAMFTEFKHIAGRDMSSPCHTATFCLSVARQIANQYLGTNFNVDEEFVIDDENIISIVSEASIVELEKKLKRT